MSANKKILVVEDDKTLLDILVARLTKEGYGVYPAANGQEGLAEALKIKPELILLDIIMPLMNGIDMIKKLRQDPWGKDARVVFLTNLSSAEELKASLEYSAIDYFIKADFSLDNLMAKIKNLLQ